MIKLKITTTSEYEKKDQFIKWLEAIKYSNAPYHKHIMEAVETGKPVTYGTKNNDGVQTSVIEVEEFPRGYRMPGTDTDVHH